MPRLNNCSGPTTLVLIFGIRYQKFAISQGDQNAQQKQIVCGVGEEGILTSDFKHFHLS